MSTQGRINKSTTKFVPKRKAGVAPTSSSGNYSGANRASSATPSFSGATPRQLPFTSTTLSSLEAIDEFDLDARGGGKGAGSAGVGVGAGAGGESLGAIGSGTVGSLVKNNLPKKITAPSSRTGSNKEGLPVENVNGVSTNIRGSSSARTNNTLQPHSLPTTKGSSNTISEDSVSTRPIQATSSTSSDLSLPTFFAPRDPSIRSSTKVTSTFTPPTANSTVVQVVNPTIANPIGISQRSRNTTKKTTNTTVDHNSFTTSLKISRESPIIRKKPSNSSLVDSSPSTIPVSAIASTSSTVLEGVPDNFNDRGLPVTKEAAAAPATRTTAPPPPPATTTAEESFKTVAAKKLPLKRGRKPKTLSAVASPPPPSLSGVTATPVDLTTAETLFVPETRRRNKTSGKITNNQEIVDESNTKTSTIQNDRDKTMNSGSGSGGSSRKKRMVPLIDIVRSPQSSARTSKRIATIGNVEDRMELANKVETVVEKSSNMPGTKRRRGLTKVTGQESRSMKEPTGNGNELGEEAEEEIGAEEEKGRQTKKKKKTTTTKRPRKLAKTKKNLRKRRDDMVSESEEEDEEEVQSLLVPSVLSQGIKLKPRSVNGNDAVDEIRTGHVADDRAHYDDEEDGEAVNEDDDHLLGSEEQETQDVALKEPIGHVVDVVVTTMADLATTKDVIAGRVSKRGLELIQMAHEKKKNRKEALRKQKELIARKDRDEAIQESEQTDYPEQDISGNINGGPQGESIREDSLPPLTTIKRRLNSQVASNIASNEVESEDRTTVDVNAGEDEVPAEEAADEYGEMATTQYAPQVRMVNGKLVVDEASLEVDRAQDERLGHVGPRVTIYEDPKDRSTTNSSTWGKQRRSERWSDEETDLFYDCLSQFGTDFEMIAGLFPARTRRQVKAKWTKEDKLNPHRITNALTRRMTIDLEKYAQITGQDLSGPVPDDPFERIQKLRSETEATDKEIGKKFGRAPTDDIAFHESFLSIAGASAPVVIEESHSNNDELAPEERMTRETEAQAQAQTEAEAQAEAEAEAQAEAEAVEAAELEVQAEVDAVLAAEEISNAGKKRGSKRRRK